MSVTADIKELIEYLESTDPNVAEQFRSIVSEKLCISRDHTLLGTLIDRYMQTRSERFVELFIGVNESHAMYLFDKLNDYLKHGCTNDVCNILFSIVKKQPSWLHKIVSTTLFTNFLKSLKNDNDITFMMYGIFVICVLMPCVPAILGANNLKEIFEVFLRSCGILLNKTNECPEVCLLYFNASVYILFHRLYAMYPNNFLTFLKSIFGAQGKKDHVFKQVIKPMFEFVKFQTDLITETRKSEQSYERWRLCQPHDVLSDCQKVSLDPVDAIKEACYATFNDSIEEPIVRRSGDSSSLLMGLNSYFSEPDHTNSFNSPTKKENDVNKINNKQLHSKALLKNIQLINGLAEVCGFTTPPCSRPISPSVSAQDVPSLQLGQKAEGNIQGSTQTLNELQLNERKSSGESLVSLGLKNNLKKTNSANSIDTSQKNLFKSLIAGATTHSTPASPKKTNTTKKVQQSMPKRPTSSENYKRDLIKQFVIGSSDAPHSAPNSPMVHGGNSHFSFNESSDNKDDTNNTDRNTPVNFRSDSPVTVTSCIQHQAHPQVLNTIKEMFTELIPKPNTEQDSALETPSFRTKSRSPLALLDDFIQYGVDIHSFQLSRIPLTSQLETDWTYFGGNPPVDELKILQMQVNLLQTQLLYERYKSDLHSLRNRRLFGNLRKYQSDMHEMENLRSQINLCEMKCKEFLQTAELTCDENRKIKQQRNKRELEFQSLLNDYERRTSELSYKLKVEKSKKEEEKRKFELVQNELLKSKHQLFDATQELLHVQPQLKELERLKETVEVLRKELFIQADKQENVKQQVKEFYFKDNKGYETERQLDACKKEMQSCLEEKEMYKSLSQSIKMKLREAEISLKKQETLVNNCTKTNESLRIKHKREIKALEERFESCRKMCQSLQSYLSSVYAKLEDSHCNKVSNNTSSSNSNLSQIAWNSHNCGEKCKRSTSYTHLDSSHHDHSHRHTIQNRNSDNPFSLSRFVQSATNLTEPMKKLPVVLSEDSGIERSSDVIRRKNTGDSNLS